jgi:hypothetical protein
MGPVSEKEEVEFIYICACVRARARACVCVCGENACGSYCHKINTVLTEGNVHTHALRQLRRKRFSLV